MHADLGQSSLANGLPMGCGLPANHARMRTTGHEGCGAGQEECSESASAANIPVVPHIGWESASERRTIGE
jgi:hypothetical protein